MWPEKMEKWSTPMIVGSKVAVLFAAWGAFTKNDLWLAPTQWLLVAAVLAIWAIYAKI